MCNLRLWWIHSERKPVDNRVYREHKTSVSRLFHAHNHSHSKWLHYSAYYLYRLSDSNAPTIEGGS